MADAVNEPVENEEDEDLADSDGDSVLTDELEDPATPPHLRNLAAIIRRGDADTLRLALVIDANWLSLMPIRWFLVPFSGIIIWGRLTALNLAIREGHLSCVKLLLERGANLEDDYMIDACGVKGSTEMVKLLLRSANSPDFVKRMLETGDYEGDTALHVAAGWGHVDVIKLLLGAGASPTVRNDHGETPIYLTKPDSQARRILVEAARAKTRGNA